MTGTQLSCGALRFPFRSKNLCSAFADNVVTSALRVTFAFAFAVALVCSLSGLGLCCSLESRLRISLTVWSSTLRVSCGASSSCDGVVLVVETAFSDYCYKPVVFLVLKKSSSVKPLLFN